MQPNKAIVGANAFAHESGIHQDGMLKHEATYEIMRPESVGAAQTRLVLGKHSGRARAVARGSRELGYALDDAALERVFARFKALADRKQVGHRRGPRGARRRRGQAAGARSSPLEGLQVGCGTQGMPTATVRLRGRDGRVRVHASVGTGPVDAAFKAIDALVQAPAELLEFSVHSVTEGIDALGEVTVRVRRSPSATSRARSTTSPGRRVPRHAADTDIIVASAKAYLAALNRMLVALGHAPKRAERRARAAADAGRRMENAS